MSNLDNIPDGNRPLAGSAEPLPKTPTERKRILTALARAARRNGQPDVADLYDAQGDDYASQRRSTSQDRELTRGL